MPVSVTQLPTVNGAPPVALRCEDAELSAPNAIERMPCYIKNRSNKLIIAAALAYSVTTEKNGKEAADITYLTAETMIHPDLRADRADNRVRPSHELPIRNSSATYNDAVVKEIKVWIDYVEFDGHTSVGPDRAGSRIVSGIRAGAAKYRAWLVNKYRQSGNSAVAIAPLLDAHLALEEVGIKSGYEEHGAIAYQNYARQLSREKGSQDLDKFLKLAADREN